MRLLGGLFCTSCYFLLAIPAQLLLLPLFLIPQRQRRRIFSAFLLRSWQLFRLLMQVCHMLGADIRPLQTLAHLRGTIVVCNHPSFIDIVLLLSTLPRTTCVVKPSLYFNPLLYLAMNIGFIRKDPSPEVTLQRAENFLQQGFNLILFPEGTRSHTPQPQLQRGFAHLALRTGAPVQPIRITYTEPFLGHGLPIHSFGKQYVKVAFQVLPTLTSYSPISTLEERKCAIAMTQELQHSLFNSVDTTPQQALATPPCLAE